MQEVIPMEKMCKVVGIIVALLIVVVFYWTRYQVIPVNYAYAPGFYKVNRLTGEVNLVLGKEYVTVEKAVDRGPRPEAAPTPETAPAPAPSPAK